MENFTTGGAISFQAFEDRRLATEKMLNELLGPKLGKIAATDKAYLKLLLPVLHTDGKDVEAVEKLRATIQASIPGVDEKHMSAIAVANRFTGVQPEFTTMNDDIEQDSLEWNYQGRTIVYRSEYKDWVTWEVGQLEGTLRGSDANFINWATL